MSLWNKKRLKNNCAHALTSLLSFKSYECNEWTNSQILWRWLFGGQVFKDTIMLSLKKKFQLFCC